MIKSTTNEYKQAYEAQCPKPQEPILPSYIFQALANGRIQSFSSSDSYQGFGYDQKLENFQQLSTAASSSNRDFEKVMVLSPIDQFSTLAGESQDPNDTYTQHSDDYGKLLRLFHRGSNPKAK